VVDHLEPKKTVRQPIGVLYTEECRKLLHTAEEHFPECVAGFALSLFAGIRQSELKRLDPEDFTDEGFVVSAVESTKVRHRRFIQITPTLEAWLKDYPITETVLPSNWDRKSKAVRRLAGWRVWSDLVPRMDFDPPLEESPPESLPEWPDNALRHTHASVAIATGKPLENLIFEFGHSGGVKTLKSHYVGVMPKKVALEILALGPKGTKVKSIRVA
jgi:integrase